MLHDIRELFGNKLAAKDGEIGRVKDIFFDDQRWAVRYLVAETGAWLTGRLVLVAPHAFGPLDRGGKRLSVALTRKQIEDCPSIESHQPVSRQYEIEYYRHYGWSGYWNGGALWGMGGFPDVVPMSEQMIAEREPPVDGEDGRDRHLQSAKSVLGYAIHATDGEIGKVLSFVADDGNWAILQMAVETGHWYSGKKILIPTARITRVSYEDSEVFVDLSIEDIREADEYDIDQVGGGLAGIKS